MGTWPERRDSLSVFKHWHGPSAPFYLFGSDFFQAHLPHVPQNKITFGISQLCKAILKSKILQAIFNRDSDNFFLPASGLEPSTFRLISAGTGRQPALQILASL